MYNVCFILDIVCADAGLKRLLATRLSDASKLKSQ